MIDRTRHQHLQPSCIVCDHRRMFRVFHERHLATGHAQICTKYVIQPSNSWSRPRRDFGFPPLLQWWSRQLLWTKITCLCLAGYRL